MKKSVKNTLALHLYFMFIGLHWAKLHITIEKESEKSEKEIHRVTV